VKRNHKKNRFLNENNTNSDDLSVNVKAMVNIITGDS